MAVGTVAAVIVSSAGGVTMTPFLTAAGAGAGALACRAISRMIQQSATDRELVKLKQNGESAKQN